MLSRPEVISKAESSPATGASQHVGISAVPLSTPSFCVVDTRFNRRYTSPVLEEIAPHIYLVHGEHRGQFPFSHSILIRDGITALIDTGCGIQRLRQIKERYSPDLVINSHAHPDHIPGNFVFEGVPLFVPRQSFHYTGRIDLVSQRFTESEELARYWRDYVKEATGFQDCLPTDQYDEVHRFDFGSVQLMALHCPGHTSDSYCFLEPNLGLAFTFDMDLSSFGPWYGHPDSKIEEFEASLQRVHDLKPATIVSSHMGVITEDLEDKFQAYARVIPDRDARILESLSEERTLEEMVDQHLIYQRYPFAPDLLRRWEENMLRKHLRRLMDRGLVERTEQG
ncbi:MAG TPA: MBL fold metallo-hydrolase, partial [Chloroflexi bacterium]|nr:MBL fold metallo-hydrolase [Chloroflexota bacterium]